MLLTDYYYSMLLTDSLYSLIDYSFIDCVDINGLFDVSGRRSCRLAASTRWRRGKPFGGSLRLLAGPCC